MTSTIIKEGMDAHARGVLKSECPYHLGATKHAEWTEGWTAALKEKADAEHLNAGAREADDVRHIERQATVDLDEALHGAGAEGPRRIRDLPKDPER